MSDHEHTRPDGTTHEQEQADGTEPDHMHEHAEHEHVHADGTSHAHDHGEHEREHGKRPGFLARLFGAR